MSEWRSLDSYPTGQTVDVLAKRWRALTDDFEFRRFTGRFKDDNYGWVTSSNGITIDVNGAIDASWRVTHWMPLPCLPSKP